MPAATEEIVQSSIGGVRVLTLNRPERRNAFTTPMMRVLATMLDNAEADPTVTGVVLTGAGSAFCAGGDMGGQTAKAAGDAYLQRFMAVQRDTVGRLHSFGKPIVAAINGAAAGAGVGLALACPIRIGTPQTRLVSGFAGVELSGDFGATWLVQRLLGTARAQSFLLLDQRIEAAECAERGIVHEVHEPERLVARAVEIVEEWGHRPAYRAILDNLADAAAGDLASVMDSEAERQLACMQTEQHRRAIQRFARTLPAATPANTKDVSR